MDSIERLVRNNAFEHSGMFGFEPGNTVYTRINRVAASEGMVGWALDALKEGFFGEHASSLILVEYEALARAPRPTLQQLYALLDEPPFEHDFENVE
jgi:sulfotransferase